LKIIRSPKKDLPMQTATFKRILFAAAITVSLMGAASVAQATNETWGLGSTSGASNDFTLSTNWQADTLPTGSFGYIADPGNHNPIMNSDLSLGALTTTSGVDSPTSIGSGTLTGPFSLTGTGTLTITGTGGSGLIVNAAKFAFTDDVNTVFSSRSTFIGSGDWTGANSADGGSGNLIIGDSGGSTTLKYTYTGISSNSQTIFANNAGSNNGGGGTNVIIYPKLDHTGETGVAGSGTVSASILMAPQSLSTIQLLGGISGRSYTSGTNRNRSGDASKTININGQTGGKVVLGDSTGWEGVMNINTADLEINNNNSLGTAGTSAAGVDYTQIGSGTLTGALRLTNNITTPETIYIYGRTTTTNPQIRNISGSNTLAGAVATDSTITGFAMISSDGTAGGDLLTVQGNIVRLGTGSGDLSLQGAGNGVVTGSITQTSSGQWNSVTKSGAGTWSLSGANSYTGTTIVTGGTLKLSGAGSIASSSSVDVRGGATFDASGVGGYSTNGVQTLKGAGTVIGNVTAGSGSDTIAPGDSGAGTLTINSGNLTLGGGTTMPFDLSSTPGGVSDKISVNGPGGGNLSLSGTTTFAFNALGGVGTGDYHLIDYSGSITSGDATNFSFTGLTPGPRQSFSISTTNVSHAVTLHVAGNAGTLVWVGGANSNAWDVGTTVNWTGETDSRFYNGDNVTFNDAATTSTPNVVVDVQPGNVTFANSSKIYSVSGPGSISVGGNFTAGAGQVTIANSANFGVAGNFVQNASGTTTINNQGAFTGIGGTITLNGTLNLNVNNDVTATNTVTGSGSFHKQGTNIVTLSGDNSGFTGSIAVDSGRLVAGAANSLGAAAGGATVASGGALDVHGSKLGAKVITIAGAGPDGSGALLDLSATGTALPSRASFSGVVLTADATIASSANSYPILDSTNGPASFNANGHTLTVQGFGGGIGEWDFYDTGETHIGNLILKDGATYFGGTTTLGDQPGVITLQNNGALGMSGSPTVTKNIVVSAADSGRGAIVSFGSNNTVASQITMNGNLEPTVVNGTNSTNPILTLAGKLTGAGSLTAHLNANGTSSRVGTVALTSDDNDYTGPTTIGGGSGLQSGTAANDRITLAIGNGGGTGKIPSGNPITVNERGTLSFNRNNAYTVTNDIVSAGADNRSSLTVDGTGTVTVSGSVSGPARILVNAGTMVLTNNNSFTGVLGIGAIGVIGSNAKLEISNDNALGAQDPSGGVSWTESNGTTATSALVLTNNINSGEYIYMAGRRTGNTAPQIINKSGNNTLSGTVSTDWGDPGSYGTGGSAADTNYAIQSDAGTLNISGNLLMQATGYFGDSTQVNGTTSGTGTLTFKGASNGTVSGPITELNSNWHLNIVKDGAGTWELSNTNSYTGYTSVKGGTLTVDQADLADGADVYLKNGATLNLTFGATDTIDSLFLNFTPQAPGTWGSLTSTADHKTALITGPGILLVSTVGVNNGDYNSDGVVDGSDYVLWRKDPTSYGGNPAGYDAWRANFGTVISSGSGAGVGASAAVPEPASCALLLCAVLGLLSGRRLAGRLKLDLWGRPFAV
jgi:fibronectin-binding autotransporter adhesin